ncbi:nitrate reductase cytochrome c-type subunit [Edwardsiella piscicida]|uniref:Periplasmic nitrate reductase, electron transfer subunit n=3 Tax=Edwardsiella TaxID=635 RepID=A0A0H3DPF6_EDWTF|nr:nitrate reductase cytochrome c-type subunit [Edwardsiella piscicida]ACY83964.1 diheme cytochrome c550 [Edwardsiella tarda EIB202]ADM41164.1 diheme cytochrome c550 [Edwardsiella tarda FL6-60]AGH73193.1 nitrate reductase cytochrome C550 subunit [Edwardsiella piscicida C07-087]AOP42537.1 nitrate reductase cytochrome c-type subunit [Edwardsiella piscicida]ARD17277.1 nitrate reductase [Edwardsiella piscicida]
MKSNVLKKRFSLGALLLSLALCGAASAADDAVNLAQSPEVSGTAEGQIRMPKQQERMALNYVNQPPMIPHSVDGYQITKNTNRCLQCHGVENYRTTGAMRVSPTHFIDASGKMLGQVAPNRYFCLQCHVPQTDAPPIVGNTFTPSTGFGQ